MTKSLWDLSDLNLNELQELSKKIRVEISTQQTGHLLDALAEIEVVVAKHGLKMSDIFEYQQSRQLKPNKAAKRNLKPATHHFINPSDQTQSWSGRGRKPGWFDEAIQACKSRSEHGTP